MKYTKNRCSSLPSVTSASSLSYKRQQMGNQFPGRRGKFYDSHFLSCIFKAVTLNPQEVVTVYQESYYLWLDNDGGNSE